MCIRDRYRRLPKRGFKNRNTKEIIAINVDVLNRFEDGAEAVSYTHLEIEKVKAELKKFTDKKLIVDIKEVKRPDKDAQLVAENIALQLENRISFRRAMKLSLIHI